MDPSMLDIDGGIGLAPDDPRNGESFVTALQEQGVVSEKMFGLILGPSGQKKIPSTITIGGIDESHFINREQKVLWFSVLNMRRWEIVMQDIKLDEVSIYTGSTKKSAVLDSFYSKIGLPEKEFEEFKKIAMAEIPTIKCTSSNSCTFP